MSGSFIPYGRQWIDEEDIAAVVNVLRSDLITQGSLVQQFEDAIAAYCGAKYAVAVSSGTAGLHLACLAADIGPGDRVLTSPITFVASANGASYCGARPDFVDIDPQTYNVNPERLEKYLNDYSGEDRVRAVIPVHFGGQPCDMSNISQIAQNHNLLVIEDACHALGSHWHDKTGVWHQVGDCSHSDMTVFSFHPVKHITTGEGGVVLTNNEALYKRLSSLRTHGITKIPAEMQRCDGPWYYEMRELGLNYRITDFQCALGMSQLKKMDSWVARRREIAHMYDFAFETVDSMITPFQCEASRSSYHLYVIQVKGQKSSYRKDVFEALRKRNIGTQVHYIPVHFQPYYKKRFDYRVGDFPEAELYYSRCLSLPVFPQMSDQDVRRVIDTVIDIVGHNRN